MMDEKTYRELVKKSYDVIEKAFDSVDPDAAECNVSQGALTIQFSTGAKLILSQQPSVRQVWVAAAMMGVAHHFDWDGTRWVDDKGKGVELHAFVRDAVKKTSAVELKI